MKRSMLLLALASTTALYAEPYGITTDTDTVVIKNPQRVTIITSDSLQQIIVNGRDGNSDYKYQNTIQLVDTNYVSQTTISHDGWNLMPKVSVSGSDEKHGTLVEGTMHIGFGLSAPTSVQSGIDFSTGSSWEIFFTPLQFDTYLFHKQRTYLSTGLGFDWRNYRMTGNQRFVLTDDGHVDIDLYPAGAESQFSRIKVFSLNVPLLFQHKFGKGFGFGIGPVLNWNTYASLKTRYKLDGGKHKDVDKHIGQRKFTIDIMGIVRTPLLDMYIKYSPNDVLREPGVQFKSLSFGIYL